MTKFETAWAEYCKTHGTPERIELMLCDLNAILRGKWLPGEEVSKLVSGDVRLPMSTYAPNILGWEVEETGLGIVVGDPDGYMVPVASTLRREPWAEGNIAQVMVEMTDEDDVISNLSTRQVLKNVVDRMAADGLYPIVATELEFYIIKKRDDSSDAPEPPDRLPEAQNYDLEVLSRKGDILTDILSAAEDLGLSTDTLIAEYGPGQFEVNFNHTGDVLDAADTALMFRRLVRHVVDSHGYEATFMAKPYADHPGNGMHVHASLVDENGKNVFAAQEDEEVSERLKSAVAGVLSTMHDLQAIFAPHLNSYRRFQPMSFAPTTPDWGFDNRSASVRLPETHGPGARLEHRICGADVNPYLALAAILGGMHHGLKNALIPPAPLDDPAYEAPENLSHDWIYAVDRFEKAAITEEVFGPSFRDLYVAVRRNEIAELTTVISPIEYSAYLSRL